MSGANSNLGTAMLTIAGDVLGHSNPALTVTSGNNQTVIIGATGVTAGLSLSNGGAEPGRVGLFGRELAGGGR